MTLKPSVLRELSDEHALTPQPIRDKYVDDATDRLCLEDELQRYSFVYRMNESTSEWMNMMYKLQHLFGSYFMNEKWLEFRLPIEWTSIVYWRNISYKWMKFKSICLPNEWFDI